ncbi:MAG: peptidase T, partial [Clostridia bacterium]|nr:peptidase T [Clostridia bacterium]
TYGPDRVRLTITPTYRNMKEVIDRYPFLIDHLKQAITLSGLTPRSVAFRGGTDGSALSHRGLPCPNLSAGYENAHGRFEFVPIPSMEKNVEILLHLAKLFGEMTA